MKITTKLILNIGHHGWATKNIFHSALLEIALKLHFVYLFYLADENIDFGSYTRRPLYEKTVKKKNYLKKKLCGILDTHRDHLYFYKNCTDQT